MMKYETWFSFKQGIMAFFDLTSGDWYAVFSSRSVFHFIKISCLKVFISFY